jgi:hypothetical protein
MMSKTMAIKWKLDWIPDDHGLEKLSEALLPRPDGPLMPIEVTGSIKMRGAIACDLADMGSVGKATAAFSRIREDLEEIGTVANVSTKVGQTEGLAE